MEGRDLLRVFPPWLEGTAGPDLAVCRLAGSIVTLSRRGRAAKRLKRTGRLGRTHMSAGGRGDSLQRPGPGGRRVWRTKKHKRRLSNEPQRMSGVGPCFQVYQAQHETRTRDKHTGPLGQSREEI